MIDNDKIDKNIRYKEKIRSRLQHELLTNIEICDPNNWFTGIQWKVKG